MMCSFLLIARLVTWSVKVVFLKKQKKSTVSSWSWQTSHITKFYDLGVSLPNLAFIGMNYNLVLYFCMITMRYDSIWNFHNSKWSSIK